MRQYYTKEEYREIYLTSPHWLRITAELYARHKRCQLCHESFKKVKRNAHHITYERLGHERLTDLVALCEDCHLNKVEKGLVSRERLEELSGSRPRSFFKAIFHQLLGW